MEPSVEQKLKSILRELEGLSDPEAVAGMAHFGIVGSKVYGVRIPKLRRIAKEAGRDHDLAAALWAVEARETRILASMVDDPRAVTEEQMEAWARDFDSWEVCDQCCIGLFRKTPFAHRKCLEWSDREEEFVKRAAFALMATLAVHDKKAEDAVFEGFLQVIIREATDSRNFVKKAVNWALRQIGKRSPHLRERALEAAGEISMMDSRAARWVAADAIRELTKAKGTGLTD